MSAVSFRFSTLLTSICLNVDAKGVAASMMKDSSKRRRTQAQIKADKEAAQQKEAEQAQKDAEIHAL